MRCEYGDARHIVLFDGEAEQDFNIPSPLVEVRMTYL